MREKGEGSYSAPAWHHLSGENIIQAKDEPPPFFQGLKAQNVIAWSDVSEAQVNVPQQYAKA